MLVNYNDFKVTNLMNITECANSPNKIVCNTFAKSLISCWSYKVVIVL